MSDEENYLRTVLNYFKETFLKYLQPKIIIDQFISKGELEVTFLSQDEENREELVDKLVDWLLEHERSTELVKLFTVFWKEYPEKSMIDGNIRNGNGSEVQVSNYLPNLIRIIDGSLIKELATEDLTYIFDKMIQNKLIIQHAKLCPKADKHFEFCIEMFRSVKARKPDWPLQFIDIISTIKPELIVLYNQDTVLHSSQTEVKKSSSESAVTYNSKNNLMSNTFSEPNHLTGSHATTVEENILSSNDSTEVKITNFTGIHVPMLNLEVEAYKPKQISSRASVTSSHFSDLSASCEGSEKDLETESNSGLRKRTEEQIEKMAPLCSGASVASSDYLSLSQDLFLTKSNLTDKRIVTKKESSAPDFKDLVKKNVIDENLIKIDDFDALSQSIGNSDSEDGSDDDDNEMSHDPALNLRDYQKELAEKAVQGLNTVICAPTGSGKTRVASHIILEHLKQNKDRNKKTIAFLTRTIPLTVQQFKVLNKSLPSDYTITYITGQSHDSLDLKTFVKRNHVVVLTPMILVNHLRNKNVRLRNFSLLIFDECHHCRKDEPYNLLMFMYLRAKLKGNERTRSNLPQIVGLSASIGIDKARNVKEASDNILKICGNLDAPYLSTVQRNKDELNELVPVPKEFDYQLKERDANDALNKIVEIMSMLEKHVKNASKELDDPDIKDLVKRIPRNKKSQDYGKWTVDLKSAARSVPIHDRSRETKEPVRTLMVLAEYLWHYNAALETHDLVELTDVMKYLKKRFSKFQDEAKRTDKEDTFFTYFLDLTDLVKRRDEEDNQNLQTLAKILMENIVDKGEDSKGIIFVRTRALAEALSSWLNNSKNTALQDLKASVFTGTNAKAEDGGMSQAEQEAVIKEFRLGEIKVLIATSVAEEGLDIPDCNLVIKYNHVGNEITTIQTKGRSRKRGGVAYLLGMENILKREHVNREKERLMKKAFVNINDMDLAEREEFIKQHQKGIIENAEIEEALAAKRRQKFKDIDFTMVCSLCRKVCIHRKNIRIIFDKFRVSIDRELLQETCLKCIPMNSMYIDELELIGPVFCQGQPKPGTICGHKLGTMVKYGGVHYFAIGVKNFGFYRNSQDKLEHFKMWKAVPYVVDELVTDDIKKYADIPTDENDTAGVSDDDYESSDDDDEDFSNAKRRPREARTHKEDKPRIVTDDKVAEELFGDEKNSVTHEDINLIVASPLTGSLAKRVESELGKAPTLTSNMEDEIKSNHLTSIGSVACSDSGSEESH